MARRSEQLDLSECSPCACFNLRKAARAVTQMYDGALQPLGLRATQFTVLAQIEHRGPINISELAARLVMDRTTLSRDLGPLEKRGWVRIVAGDDRRTRAVNLTAKGRALLKAALPVWRQAQKKITGSLGADAYSGLLGNLSSTVAIARGSGG